MLFDAYGTLFDVYSVGVVAERLFPGAGERLGILWRDKQIEYTRLTSMSGQARSFRDCTRAGLRYAARRFDLALDDAAERELMGAYERLAPFAENRAVLVELRRRGIRAGILSNGDPDMLDAVVRHAGFAELLDPVLSVEGTGRFKTDPATYALGTRALGLAAAEVLFVSSNCWDAIGATWFGYTTLWINRFGLPLDELGAPADADRHPAHRRARLLRLPRTFAMTLTLPAGMQINAPILPGFETILTRAGARARRQAAPRLRAAPPGAARRARRARQAPRRRRAARLPRRDRGDPRRRLEDRAGAAGAALPPRRDHRAGRRARWSSTPSTRAPTRT